MASSAFSFHCMICFEEFDPSTNYPVVLPCGHTYVCIECANRLDKCMECRMPLITKIEIPPSSSAGSNDPVQKENSLPGGPSSRYSSTVRRTSLQQQQQQRPRGSKHSYSHPQPPPQKQFITQRLPLPKNAVLLSLIQASEPARRRQAEEQAAALLPQLPQSPLDEDRKKTRFKFVDSVESSRELPKYSKLSPLFLDPFSPASYDTEGNPAPGGIRFDDTNDEAQKIRVGTYLEGGPCGTYAVAVKTGLLVYPTLFEHSLRSNRDEEDGVTRDVDELVKSSYRKKYFSQREGGGGGGPLEKKGKGCGLPRSISLARSALESAFAPAGSEGEGGNLATKTAEITLEHCDSDGHGLFHEGIIAVEAQITHRRSNDDNPGDDISRIRTNTGPSSGFKEQIIERHSAMSDPGGFLPTAIPAVALFANDTPRTTMSKNISKLSSLSKNVHCKSQTPPRTVTASPLTGFTPDDIDPALSATLKLRRQFSLGSSNPAPVPSGDPDFDRPLIRLKYGDRVQVVSMDSRGWVKLARGYGYIRLENAKQLVKVGGTSDKACQIEAVLHELSIERNRLKNEQKELERLSAGLMIDLQSSLLTSDDLVIVQAPEGMPRSESELSLLIPPKNFDRQSSNTSHDDLDINCRTRSVMGNPPKIKLTHGRPQNINNETQPHEIRSVKSHSPVRNFPTPPSPPYNQMTPGGSTVTPSYAMTPTRVNFRTGLSGHRALSSSHSHPHDFIDRGGPSRTMSNHSGLSSSGLSSKKPSNLRGRTVY